MPDPAETPPPAKGAVVTARTLTVAPVILGKLLAEPWRRLGGMFVDLLVIAGLSILSGPWLAIGTGAMLIVLFGNDRESPLPKKLIRWVCRGLGAVVVALAILALGHAPFIKKDWGVLTGKSSQASSLEPVWIAPDASMSDLRRANDKLQQQVSLLKSENKEQRAAAASWAYQARNFAGALGVTFGWSGIYFTLMAGTWGGRSLGKFVFRTVPLKTDGTPFTYFDAFIRHGGYVAGVAMGLTGFLKLLWEPNRQAVEDRIAGTVVVNV